jgi:cation transport ATPase
VLLVSGDREAEVRRLAEAVAIVEVYASTSPEGKVAIVRREAAQAPTVFVGDGINDAPALMTATVGIAFGQHSDVTSEAARVVIIDSSLSKVDELIHLSYRLRRVALQSAVGGMVLSMVGMAFAAGGWLSPVAGAIAQEGIDLLAVLNALRTARGSAPDRFVPEATDRAPGSTDADRVTTSSSRNSAKSATAGSARCAATSCAARTAPATP